MAEKRCLTVNFDCSSVVVCL